MAYPTEKPVPAAGRRPLAPPRAASRMPLAGARSAPAPITAPVRSHPTAKAVGSFLPRLTRTAFEKFGFSAATLLTDWPRIVGADLARSTEPERLKWPRTGAPGEEPDGRSGATLVLRVDPAVALDVEYRSAQLIERINTFFGYRAVAGIRLLQAPLAVARAPAAQTPRTPSPAAPAGVALRSIAGEDPLSAALRRMHEGIRARSRSA